MHAFCVTGGSREAGAGEGHQPGARARGAAGTAGGGGREGAGARGGGAPADRGRHGRVSKGSSQQYEEELTLGNRRQPQFAWCRTGVGRSAKRMQGRPT